MLGDREQLTVLCVEGSIALAEDGMFDIAGEIGKFHIVRSLCERADFVLAMGACAAYGGWQAQPPNPSGAVGLQYTLDAAGGLLPPEWRSRAGHAGDHPGRMPGAGRHPGRGDPLGIEWCARRPRPLRDCADGSPVPAQHRLPRLRDTAAARAALHRLHRPEVPQLRRGPPPGAVGLVTGQHAHEEVPRSEGDLRIYWDERDGRIDEAWCQGTMYRGYEMILIGRYPEDALATTARLCGICSTSHVVAATHALEDAWNIIPPAQAVRLRNLFLAAESMMSDARQGALFFGPGLCHPSFAEHPLYDEIMRAFQPPFVGWLPRQVRTFSKRILGVITAFTQQWPHSIPFRPGGATCPIGREEIHQARAAVNDYATWYAPTILGGTLDEWAEITTAAQFQQWIDQHPQSIIGLYTRYATDAARLHLVGRGSGNLLSGGLYRDPESPGRPLIPGGVLVDGTGWRSTRPWSVSTAASPGSPTRAHDTPPTSWSTRTAADPSPTAGPPHPGTDPTTGHAARSPGRTPDRRRPAHHRPRHRLRHQRLPTPTRPLDTRRRPPPPHAPVARRARTITR